MTIVTNEELTQQLSEALSRIAALEDRLAAEQVPTAAAWPTPATLDQGFLAGRWQRRDGATPAEGLPPSYVSEAPADG